MPHQHRTTTGRALEINLDPQIYGAFAEIGAGQEVARHFFQAGQASQTIAKTISAYDMIYSDEIYGREESGRYVCKSRLEKMLSKEFQLLKRRLDPSRGSRSQFFAFANTVTTGDQNRRTCHGWMGIRFQATVGGPHNDIILHVRMLDRFRLQQTESLGVLGVNLVSTAFFHRESPMGLIDSLTENLRPGQVAIDMIHCEGPDLAHLQDELLNLELVRRNLTNMICFDAKGRIANLADATFGHPLLIFRGHFDPFKPIHRTLLDLGEKHMQGEIGQKPLTVLELTTHSFTDEDSKKIDLEDYLARVRSLTKQGMPILVSRFFTFAELTQFLMSHTKEQVRLIVGGQLLEKIFDPQFYPQNEGGILSALAPFMNPQIKLYVYPFQSGDVEKKVCTFTPPPPLSHLFQFFQAHEKLVDLTSEAKVPGPGTKP